MLADEAAILVSREVTAARVCRCDDGIIEVRIHDGAVVGRTEMAEILAAEVEIAEGPILALIDARAVKSMTRQAQEHIASTADQRNVRAVAILIASPVSRLLGNFFLRLSRPIYPTRLFSEGPQVRAWLLEHRPGEDGE